MKTIKAFGNHSKYSLHDARVQKIEYADNNLILTFEYIFSYENGVEQTHKAQVVFETCDIDFLKFSCLIIQYLILSQVKELSYLSISRSIVIVNLRSLQRPIIGDTLYSRVGYGLKGILYTV